MDLEKLQGIQKYVFETKHDRGDGHLDFFDLDYEMAQSWKRLLEPAK